jgi:hypothetical protein
MNLALIPPKGWERWALASRTQLMLAQVTTPAYIRTYREASERGDYVIVDNGAYEGAPVGDFKLFSAAEAVHANEIVLPDMMRDLEATMLRVKQFIRHIGHTAYILEKFAYMGVAQGKTFDEVLACVEYYSRLSIVRTIGLPRHLLQTLNVKTARVSLAMTIEERYGSRFAIHFLGVNPSHPYEVHDASMNTYARSVDTSMPFNYAIAKEKIHKGCKVIDRPPHYLGEMRNMDMQLLKSNIAQMEKWANAKASASQL